MSYYFYSRYLQVKLFYLEHHLPRALAKELETNLGILRYSLYLHLHQGVIGAC
jgi:hypothetical protein